MRKSVNCAQCGKLTINSKFCSRKCSALYQKKAFLKDCFVCGKQTLNYKFCSRSCAMSVINKNKTQKRRKALRICKTCDCEIHTHNQAIVNGKKNWVFCRDCLPNPVDMLGERLLRYYDEKSPNVATKWNDVRTHCRIVNADRMKVCQHCGYDKHIEYCHIKAISSYDLDTTLLEVNRPENILLLCRNCHWELDHNHLQFIPPLEFKQL